MSPLSIVQRGFGADVGVGWGVALALALTAAGALPAPPATPTPTATPASFQHDAPAAGPSTAALSGTPSARTELEASSRARLGRILSVFSGQGLRKDDLAIVDIDLAIRIAAAATEASPDDVSTWRSLLRAVSLGDPADPTVDALRRRALERISLLDPLDEVVRLRRIVDVVEREPTAEGRIAIYRELLKKANRAVLGPVIASRLALDFALLLQRTGDERGFEEWLAEAATLDPASPSATAMAAGYFRFRAETPAQEAELLLAAMAANPLDPMPTRGLATMLLERGAYVGAARFLGIAAKAIATDLPMPEYDALLTDQAIALWGAGQPERAADLLKSRQLSLSVYLRDQLAKADPSILSDRARLMSQRYPVPSQSSVARAAILHSAGDKAALAAALEDAYFSLESEAEEAGRRAALAGDEQERMVLLAVQATTRLQAAFVALWIGEDRDRANRYLDQAVAFETLSEEARRRFACWFALRGDDPAVAAPLFASLADGTPQTRLGRGLAYEAAGRTRDAAVEFLAVMREGPGTVLGVYARDRLAAILGRTPPPEAVVVELEAVAASLPVEFDRLFSGESRVVSLRIRTPEVPADVFAAIPIEIEIANQGPVPLAIGPEGPIRDLLLLQASVSAAGTRGTIEFPDQVVSLARSLVVPARGRVTVPVDLAHRDIGGGIVPFVASGVTLAVRGLLNWEPTVGGFRPGPLGDRADANLIRIDGVRVTREWVDATLARAAGLPSPEDLVDIVALAQTAARARLIAAMPAEDRASLDRVWTALADLMPRVDRWTRAWLVAVLPDDHPDLEPAIGPTRTSDDPIVRIVYLVRRCGDSADPALDDAIRSSDARISEFGRLIRATLVRDERRKREELNLGSPDAAARTPAGEPARAEPPRP